MTPTLANGEAIKSKDMEFTSGKTEISMKENGVNLSNAVKDRIFSPIKMYTQENMKKVCQMVMGSINGVYQEDRIQVNSVVA